MATTSSPQILSTHQVAKLLGVDMTTVIDWCQQGKIPAYKTPGGHRRIRAQDLLEFLGKYSMPVPPALASMTQLRCLVVDDEPAIHDMVRRVVLEAYPDAEVDQAGDGFEAGKKVLDSLPKLVVLDINLPGLNGIKVCEALRADSRFKSVKILAICGESGEEMKTRVRAAGADDFLAKPFDRGTLEPHLKALLP